MTFDHLLKGGLSYSLLLELGVHLRTGVAPPLCHTEIALFRRR
jgi:hypothetical protein